MNTRDGRWAWVDGQVVEAATATASVLDRGLVVGDGAFETIPVTDDQPFAITRHLARLRRSLGSLGIVLGRADDDLADACRDLVTRNGDEGRRIRLTVTGGLGGVGTDRTPAAPTVIVTTTSVVPHTPTTAVATVPWCRNERGAVAGVKSTSYAENVVALAHAKQRGASEALFGNTRDEVCEGTGSNIFLVIGGTLVTPPLDSGCLAGITRELVGELVPVEERAVPMAGLPQVEAAFLTSSTRDVQPVAEIDGRPLDPAHPLVVNAHDAFMSVRTSMTDP